MGEGTVKTMKAIPLNTGFEAYRDKTVTKKPHFPAFQRI